MALPNSTITKIPNNEPDAVPALWNLRYEEIDQNFSFLEQGRAQMRSELDAAKGNKGSVGERLDDMSAQLQSLSPDYQDDLSAAVMFGLDQAAVANRSVQALKEQAQQEGEVTISNRGVVSGCSVSRSTTAARNLNLENGIAFMNGRIYAAPEKENAASVPSNTGTSSVTVYAYLYFHEATQRMRVSVTAIGEEVPEHGIHIYTITIPADSTDETDPNLDYVTLTNVRRMEPEFPANLQSPRTETIAIKDLRESDYRIDIDLVSAVGEPCRSEQVEITSRATNGFTLRLATGADDVVVRWRVSKLNN
ncbi:hypothetical protein [Halomonas sp. OfavH-34-E]|uniref:hypothetical protein n=1 Tax=Halomonas sp. OfavH-34-E TaxID=2954491 RepID=UPI002097A884|nr:hypothetical protein [Halomonas sp. OfavH-34-E]MCO7215997.1 hypothetical protein [Halomonas sp. OfavH-34-E]